MTDQQSKPKATRSRRKTTRSIDLSPEARELLNWTCRKCLRNRAFKDFYKTTDPTWDQTGHYSICRFCIDEAYERLYVAEKSLEKAILKLCRILNARYDSVAIEATKKNIEASEARGKAASGIFGIYRKNLVTTEKGFGGFDGDKDLTFQEGVKYDVINPLPDDFEATDYLKEFWGSGLDFEDYSFLEREYARFKETHKADTYAEKVLLKLVCFKLLEINKMRKENSSASTAGREKELQELMKNLAISPQYAKAVDEGKNMDTFGMWIAEIEQEEPAQWLEGDGHNMFYDVDDVEGYFQKFFVRPLKNAILQSSDFNIDDDADSFEEYDMEGLNDGEESQTLSEE